MRWLERRRIERVLLGDPEEAERLVRELYPDVLRLLRHLTHGHEDAVDLAQRTFVNAHLALPNFRFDCPLRNWFLRIAVREFLHWRRDRKVNASLEDVNAAVSMSVGDDLVLREAVAALDVEMRESFLLRNVEGLSTRETAELLGIPEGTVKSRCHAARQRLQVLLAPTFLPDPRRQS